MMGKALGTIDPNATIGIPGSGGAPGTEVADPNMGLTGGQMFGRRALQAGLRGLGSGLQQQGNQQGGYGGYRGGMPVNFNFQQPQVDPSYFGMGRQRRSFFDDGS